MENKTRAGFDGVGRLVANWLQAIFVVIVGFLFVWLIGFFVPAPLLFATSLFLFITCAVEQLSLIHI